MYGLVVRFELLDGHETAFDALASATLESVEAAEPGTAVYLAHRVAETPGVRVFYELYDDVDAFETHERAPHVQRFLAERGQHLRADPEVWVAEPTAGLVRSAAGARCRAVLRDRSVLGSRSCGPGRG